MREIRPIGPEAAARGLRGFRACAAASFPAGCAATPGSGAAISASRRLQPLRVLLVDDRETVGLAHEKTIWRHGGAATRTTTLDEALRLARERRFDLALVRQSMQGRAGTVVALTLPELQPGLRVLAYDMLPDPRVSLLADRLGRSLTCLAEDRVAAWVETSVPLLARIARDERRVNRATRKAARKYGVLRSSILPINLHDLYLCFEEALVRSALDAAKTQRRAARLLGIPESSLRTRLVKLGLRSR